MFKKILVANRGDIAVRVIRACKELGIPTVAVYSQADVDSLAVRMADEAVCIGPAPSKESYLHAPNILSAALITGCDALHPGIGFMAESASFAEACTAMGIKFIGPSSSAIEKMGDKITAKSTMRRAGVPVVPGGDGAVKDEADAQRIAAQIGYPIKIKASAGGGGRGIRTVFKDEELGSTLKMAQAEAEASFGNPDVYIEKHIEQMRHIEVQIIGDEHGNVVHLGERDCSIQTARHQKILEECRAPNLDDRIRRKICEAAVKAAKAVNYQNAGTVEFIYAPNGEYYFMEMNTRLQIEHCVTEVVTNLDLVKLQIKIAAGQKLGLTQRDITWTGHAIEARLTARDPERGFAPSAGVITGLRLPGGPGIRVDTHVYAGANVPPYYDSMIAKIIAWDVDRNAAIAKLARALSETDVDGIKTDVAFLRDIVDHPVFKSADLSTNFLVEHMGDS
ncbi:MAG: acetyl-CoA carboxylase biotin carboxylase subunit [Capsulimonadaceae bacterium]|nr:acetyl-CoA carboxylase biotin carboxylase subunit [Capsulimonadaceae bacterium]